MYAVGDVAWITDTNTNEVLPQLGGVALQSGEHAGANIRARFTKQRTRAVQLFRQGQHGGDWARGSRGANAGRHDDERQDGAVRVGLYPPVAVERRRQPHQDRLGLGLGGLFAQTNGAGNRGSRRNDGTIFASPSGEGVTVDPEFLSRLQFALTISFHFIYPPISMGLGLLMVVMGWQYICAPKIRSGGRHRFSGSKSTGLSLPWASPPALCRNLSSAPIGRVLALCRQHLWQSPRRRRHLCLFPGRGVSRAVAVWRQAVSVRACGSWRHSWLSLARTFLPSGSSWQIRGCRRRKAMSCRRRNGGSRRG